MIKEDLVAERIAIDSYREMINYIGDKDTTTKRMLEGHPRDGGRARRRPGWTARGDGQAARG